MKSLSTQRSSQQTTQASRLGSMTNATAIATPYEDLLKNVLENGAAKSDRTGTGTRSLFGHQLRYDLSESFPLLTTKKVYFHGVIGELLWFLRGESNVSWLQEKQGSYLERVGR